MFLNGLCHKEKKEKKKDKNYKVFYKNVTGAPVQWNKCNNNKYSRNYRISKTDVEKKGK